jgi:hypothetical protein
MVEKYFERVADAAELPPVAADVVENASTIENIEFELSSGKRKSYVTRFTLGHGQATEGKRQ